MKGINTPGQALERGGVASFSELRGSRISPCFPGTRSVMGARTMVMLVLLSLRW
ncbi:MAG: hypothetical protein JEY71_18210 [Sphaerochaeta sp.]|nr:hypothetical protein [Sphaerochaeta sp.]